jgi:hypothetical protein
MSFQAVNAVTAAPAPDRTRGGSGTGPRRFQAASTTAAEAHLPAAATASLHFGTSAWISPAAVSSPWSRLVAAGMSPTIRASPSHTWRRRRPGAGASGVGLRGLGLLLLLALRGGVRLLLGLLGVLLRLIRVGVALSPSPSSSSAASWRPRWSRAGRSAPARPGDRPSRRRRSSACRPQMASATAMPATPIVAHSHGLRFAHRSSGRVPGSGSPGGEGSGADMA